MQFSTGKGSRAAFRGSSERAGWSIEGAGGASREQGGAAQGQSTGEPELAALNPAITANVICNNIHDCVLLVTYPRPTSSIAICGCARLAVNPGKRLKRCRAFAMIGWQRKAKREVVSSSMELLIRSRFEHCLSPPTTHTCRPGQVLSNDVVDT